MSGQPLPGNARLPEPFYDDGFARIYLGDALDVLACLEAERLDAVVMDPPYASGARTEAGKPGSGGTVSKKSMDAGRARGSKWAAKPIDNDTMTSTGFVWLMREVARACRPLLADGGGLLSFIDWRQWPNLVGAIESANYRVNGMVVWDKCSYGLGNGFRAQHELVLYASKGSPNVVSHSVGSVLQAKREPNDDHPSPKPIALMERLLEVVAPVGGIVLDPFMGSGSTLRAAKNIGVRSIGIESEERYCEHAARRLGQESLFGEAS